MIFKLIIFCSLIFKLSFCEALTPEGFNIIDNKVNSHTKINKQTSEHREQPINTPNGVIPTIGYYPSDGVDFDGRTSGFAGSSLGKGDRNCLSSSTESFADHEIVMQSHDVLDGVRVWVEDNDAVHNLGIIVYESCLPTFSAGAIENNIILSDGLITNAGFASEFFLINRSYKGRHDDCKMMMRVRFGNSSSSCSGAPNISLQKVRAQLRLNDLIFANGFE